MISLLLIKETENKVADALSRKLEEEEPHEAVLTMISFPTPDWVEELKASYGGLVEAQQPISSLSSSSDQPKGF